MPRRVAFLTPLYFDEESGYIGGGERYPLNIARGVVAASGGQTEVAMISYGRRASVRDLDAGISLRVIPISGPRHSNEDSVSWHLPAALADCDLLHVHQALTRSGEAALLSAKMLGLPVCITDHGGSTSRVGIDAGMCEVADAVIAYSDFGASMIPTDREVIVIKGGVDGSFFHPADPQPAREHVMYVGRLLAHKGIDQLIAALPEGMSLLVCGRPYDERYFGLLRSLAEGKAVTFITDAGDEQLRELYRRALAVVLPSVYRDCFGNRYRAPELMGFTLLEGMACRAPAICNDVAAMPEFVEDGSTGFVYGSLEQLTGQLCRLRDDPALTEELGANARRAVDERFDLRIAGARMLDVYRSLTATEVFVS